MSEEKAAASIVDLNKNGIPDYQETWFYVFLWGFTRSIVRALAPEHTLVRRAVEAIDDALEDEKP